MAAIRWVTVAGVVLATGWLGGCEKQRVTSTSPSADVEAKRLASWNFDEIAAGQLPEGFEPGQNHPTSAPEGAMATWKVVADPDAVSSPNVLAVETHNGNATFNLLPVRGTLVQDLDVSVRVRGNTGEHDQGGGVMWRAVDENNYYVCRMNPLETNFRVYKVVDGKRKQLATAEAVAKSGQWHEVRAVMVGDRIWCYLDGKELLDVRDDQFKDAGMIGLWTKADASSSFDDLVVTKPQVLDAAAKEE